MGKQPTACVHRLNEQQQAAARLACIVHQHVQQPEVERIVQVVAPLPLRHGKQRPAGGQPMANGDDWLCGDGQVGRTAHRRCRDMPAGTRLPLIPRRRQACAADCPQHAWMHAMQQLASPVVREVGMPFVVAGHNHVGQLRSRRLDMRQKGGTPPALQAREVVG